MPVVRALVVQPLYLLSILFPLSPLALFVYILGSVHDHGSMEGTEAVTAYFLLLFLSFPCEHYIYSLCCVCCMLCCVLCCVFVSDSVFWWIVFNILILFTPFHCRQGERCFSHKQQDNKSMTNNDAWYYTPLLSLDRLTLYCITRIINSCNNPLF